MAVLRIPDPVLLVTAVFSRHAEASTWAQQHLEGLYGPVAMTSPEFAFNQTTYYEPTMGAGLRKRFLAFRELIAAPDLPDIKRKTIELEQRCSASGLYPEPRPLNLDPGILSLGKFQLATTKDQAHRVYLRDGIFVEVTLRFQAGAFEVWPWTYADYRQECVRDFLKEARDYYRLRLGEVKRGLLQVPSNEG
jgi:hypothetical protein